MGERRDLRDLLRDTDFDQRRIIDDLSSYKEDQHEKDIAREVGRGGASDFLKNLFVGLLLVAIVIGSFWVSFLVGKRVLVPPIKNIPTIEFPIPKAITAFQIKRAAVVKPSKEESSVKKEIKAVAVRPKVSTSPRTSSAVVAKKYYKVIAGTFSSSSSAKSLAKKLAQKGFSYYVKKVSGVWRVQVGALATKKQAQNLVSRLKAKGFSPKIIYE